MATIVNSGDSYKAARQAAQQPVVITHFVYADISGLDSASPVDPAEVWPVAGDIVHERAVDRGGYLSPNKLVYSSLLPASVGDFQFNWIGLKTDDGTLYSVAYSPLTQKIKTVVGLSGNTLVRSFLLEWDGALSDTNINIAADTWQLDFTGWLDSLDENERLSNFDTYGAQSFFDTCCEVYNDAGTYKLKTGVGYVAGVRIEIQTEQTINPGALPKDVWLDVSLQGDINGVNADIQLVFNNAAQVDYVDGANRQHFLIKIASINAAGAVTDERVLYNTGGSVIAYLTGLIATSATTLINGVVRLATASEMSAETETSRVTTVKVVADYVNAKFNALAAGVSASYDTMAEIAAAINDLYAQVAQRVRTSDINNTVSSTSTTQPLSANQGKVLNDKFSSYSLVANIINNFTSTATDKPLSADRGRELKNLVDSRVSIADIINALNSTSITQPLSANQGKVLNDKFAAYSLISSVIDNVVSTSTNEPLSANQGRVLKELIDAIDWSSLPNKPATFAPAAHTHNYAALSHTHNYAALSHSHSVGLLSSSGYWKDLSTGWTVQWTTTPTMAPSGTFTWTFPLAFSSVCWGIFGNTRSSSIYGGSVEINTNVLSRFQGYAVRDGEGGGGSAPAFLFAVGL